MSRTFTNTIFQTFQQLRHITLFYLTLMPLHQVSPIFFPPAKERTTQEFPHKQFWEKEEGASQNCNAIHSLSSGRDKPLHYSCDFYVSTPNYSIFSIHTH